MTKLKDFIPESKLSISPLVKLLKSGGFERSTGRQTYRSPSGGEIGKRWGYDYFGSGYSIQKQRNSTFADIEYQSDMNSQDDDYLKKLGMFLKKHNIEYQSDKIHSYISVDLKQF